MSNPGEDIYLLFRPRPKEIVAIDILPDTWASIERMAEIHDMSIEGLLRYYIEDNLEKDLTKYFIDRVMEKTSKVLSKYIDSREDLSAILKEILEEAKR